MHDKDETVSLTNSPEMDHEQPAKSHFKRPFGTAPARPAPPGNEPAPPAGSTTSGASSGSAGDAPNQLVEEWRALEARIGGPGAQDPQQAHREVSDFLRKWGLEVAQTAPAGRETLAPLLESARSSLMALIAILGDNARVQTVREVEAQSRQSARDSDFQRRQEAREADIRRLREETSRIEMQTSRERTLANERNYQLSKAGLFPENHCPYCSRSYLDLTGGCWHCQHHHRPGYF